MDGRAVTLVVRRRQPLLIIGLTVAAALLAGGAAWWTMTTEGRQLHAAYSKLRSEHDTLRMSYTALESERAALQRRVAVLERARQIDTAAYAKVGEQLAELNEQLLAMKEEVAFYEGIVGSDRAASGVRIQRFVVEPEGTQQDYRFHLVLTRGIRSDSVVSGEVTLAVDGDQAGERKRLDLSKLTPFPAGRLEYSFKHFQRIEGRLRLPPQFVPKRVIVRVDSTRQGSKPLRESYRWPSLNS